MPDQEGSICCRGNGDDLLGVLDGGGERFLDEHSGPGDEGSQAGCAMLIFDGGHDDAVNRPSGEEIFDAGKSRRFEIAGSTSSGVVIEIGDAG